MNNHFIKDNILCFIHGDLEKVLTKPEFKGVLKVVLQFHHTYNIPWLCNWDSKGNTDRRWTYLLDHSNNERSLEVQVEVVPAHFDNSYEWDQIHIDVSSSKGTFHKKSSQNFEICRSNWKTEIILIYVWTLWLTQLIDRWGVNPSDLLAFIGSHVCH